jgi:hypothetical protein
LLSVLARNSAKKAHGAFQIQKMTIIVNGGNLISQDCVINIAYDICYAILFKNEGLRGQYFCQPLTNRPILVSRRPTFGLHAFEYELCFIFVFVCVQFAIV